VKELLILNYAENEKEESKTFYENIFNSKLEIFTDTQLEN